MGGRGHAGAAGRVRGLPRAPDIARPGTNLEGAGFHVADLAALGAPGLRRARAGSVHLRDGDRQHRAASASAHRGGNVEDGAIPRPLARLSRQLLRPCIQRLRRDVRRVQLRGIQRQLRLQRLVRQPGQLRLPSLWQAVRHWRLRRLGGFGGGLGGSAAGLEVLALAASSSTAVRRGRSRTPAGRWACRSASTATSAAAGARRRRRRCPGSGVGEDMVRRDFADSAFWTANAPHRRDRQGDRQLQAARLADQLARAVTAVSPKMHVGTGDGEVQEHAGHHDLADAAAHVHRGRHGPRVRHRPQPHRQGADHHGPPEGRERRRCCPTASRP